VAYGQVLAVAESAHSVPRKQSQMLVRDELDGFR